MAQGDDTEQVLTTVRETVESIAVAVVLAFVLRAFVLEAFVIPTGSMAPRLMGQHWQFDCPACGYRYAYGIPRGASPDGEADLSTPLPPPGRGSAGPAYCPNCGYAYDFGSRWASSGDRVLVLKYLYRFREPAPWDVVVFKNPQDNDQNFIKRLIGLPGQMVEIIQGDIWVRQGKDFNDDGVIDKQDFDNPRAELECPWQILRKPARTQDVMWQVIFDNDYQPDVAVYNRDKNDTQYWHSPWEAGDDSPWNLKDEAGRVFSYAGSGAPAALRFVAPRERFQPHYAYNRSGNELMDPNRDVVSDLKLSFLFVPKADKARVSLHISNFSHHFRATVGQSGLCKLEHGRTDGATIRWDPEPWSLRAASALELGKGVEVALTHVDHQVTLWVDGEIALQSFEQQYPARREEIVGEIAAALQSSQVVPPVAPVPTVEIVGDGGALQLRHISLTRDVYYTCPNLTDNNNRTLGLGFACTALVDQKGKYVLSENPMVLRKYLNNPDMDEFFVLGDNSPQSKDSRLWAPPNAPTLREGYRDGTVPRYNMIGRAFFVYWPGGFRLPVPDKNIPIVPNVGRMRLIR
jgi:signal peptidase I